MFEEILKPVKINQMELKNRMVVSAMVSLFANEDGTPTEKFIAYHEAKAKGGWGLIITEDYIINPTAGGFKALPGLYNDELIDAHKKLTERIHLAGGKIAAQIYHAGRETSSEVTGVHNVAPSAIKDPTMSECPYELSVEEIHQLVEEFGDCALRVKKAGFDAVEIHGAHGYLINQFVSPFSNKRSDEYGGTIHNRARFALEIVKNIRSKVGDDYPIIYRMSSQEYVPGGLTLQDTQILAQLLEKTGVDAINCSQGVYASLLAVIPPTATPRGLYADNSAAIKAVVNIPVFAVGRINDPYIAENILKSGKADLVVMARASLADPQLPNKVAAGKDDEINHCIGCMQGCIGEQSLGKGIRCLVNPLMGMEDEFKITASESPKTIFVAGGGVCGCEAAMVLAMRGHKVTLFEKSNKLGGQWLAAAAPIGKSEFTSFLQFQEKSLRKYNVEIRLNTELTKDMLKDADADVLIVATGSKPSIPPIEGVQRDNVVSAHDVLLGKKSVGNKVVVIGGGLAGAETADHLATHGSKVAIIEMLPQIVKDGEPNPTALLIERLQKNKVDIYTSTSVLEIGENYVVIDTKGSVQTLNDVDNVVIATGVRSYNPFADLAEDYHGEVIVLGDAGKVANGYYNIQQAFEAALNI